MSIEKEAYIAKYAVRNARKVAVQVFAKGKVKIRK